MKVRIEKNVLNNGLGQVLNVVGMRTSLPVLSNVRLCAREGALELTTTNLDMGIRCTVAADVKEGGSIALPARRLASIAKALPEGTIELECSDDQAKLSCGCSKFRIMGMNDAEFPPLPMFEQTEALVVEQQQLRGWLRHVSFAQSEDENRYLLNGVLFAFKGGEEAANGETADSGNVAELHVVATDGRRLSLMQQSMEVPQALCGKSFILPSKAVGELEHLLQQSAPVKLYFNNRQVGFELELDENAQKSGLAQSIYLVSKQIEGTFPNYLQVLPKTMEHRVRLERTLLLESIQRAALVSNLDNGTVKLTFNQNLLEISASSAEFGEAHESIAVEYEAGDKPISITFNSKFLTDPLKALDEDAIFFEFKDEVSPGVIKTNDNFRCVVMPLRLG
ncbi:MAG: DNA polymerase III subunit beta [Opitutales bacterium]|nr:DNA polymerase III subunit beta [Opitutales bacterium]